MDNNLTPELIINSLKTQLIGKDITYLESVPSTMDVVREKAAASACEGTVVIAEKQTSGRGRLKRLWKCSPG